MRISDWSSDVCSSDLLPGVGRVPEDGPGQNGGPDGVQAELERGDHAEVAAAAPQRPKQVGVLVLGLPQQLAVGGHDVDGEEVVDREAVLAHQPADATDRKSTRLNSSH